MKKIIILLFLFCTSVAYSYNHPIHMNLNKKYYVSWADYHLNNIALIYSDVVVNNKKIPVFSDSSLVKQMSAREIREKIVLVKYNEDTSFYVTGDNYFIKFEYYFINDSIHSVGFYRNELLKDGTIAVEKKPTVYIKWSDIENLLDEEEKFTLKIIFKKKK